MLIDWVLNVAYLGSKCYTYGYIYHSPPLKQTPVLKGSQAEISGRIIHQNLQFMIILTYALLAPCRMAKCLFHPLMPFKSVATEIEMAHGDHLIIREIIEHFEVFRLRRLVLVLRTVGNKSCSVRLNDCFQLKDHCGFEIVYYLAIHLEGTWDHSLPLHMLIRRFDGCLRVHQSSLLIFLRN